MKIRNGFVSNSSSSSFMINKAQLHTFQIDAIKNHIEFANKQGWDCGSDQDAWDIKEDDFNLRGDTSMDNFDMEQFFIYIGVKMDAVHWGH